MSVLNKNRRGAMALKIERKKTVKEPDEVIAPGEQGSEVVSAKADLAPYLKELTAMVEKAKAYVVNDKDSFGQAGQMRQQVKKLKKAIVDVVGKYKRPHWDLCKEYDGLRNKHTKACDDIEKVLKGKSDSYVKTEREMERRNQEAELEKQRQAAAEENKRRLREYEAQKKAAREEAQRRQAAVNKKAEEDNTDPVSVTAVLPNGPDLLDVPETAALPRDEKVAVEGANVHVKMIKVPVIKDLAHPEIFELVKRFYLDDYRKLVEKTLKKAFKNQIYEIPGVGIEEQADTSLRATK